MPVPNRPSLPLAAALAAFVAALPASPGASAQPASGFEQQAVHEHGRITLNIALEGSDLAVELESPAVHVLGFERAPRTADEKTRFEAAARWLGAGTGIVGVPNGAGCVLASAAVTPPEFGKPDGKDHDHGHDHGHDHDHSHGHSGDAHGAHADYRARFRFTCRNPAALAWAEPWLLRRLREVEVAQVNVISPTGQRQLTVREPAARIPLR